MFLFIFAMLSPFNGKKQVLHKRFENKNVGICKLNQIIFRIYARNEEKRLDLAYMLKTHMQNMKRLCKTFA